MTKTDRRTLIIAAGLLLAGCATEAPRMAVVAPGEAVVKGRLVVRVDGAWNRFERGPQDPWPMWTREGATIDALTFMVGVRDGESIVPTPKETSGARPLVFRAAMQPAEIVELLQAVWTRDGSSFTLERLAPFEFVGVSGFRFEYAFVRKADDARMKGVAWGAVRGGELFLIDYMALRLGFFARFLGDAEALARSARVSG